MRQQNWKQLLILGLVMVASGVGALALQTQRFGTLVESVQNPTQEQLDRASAQDRDRLQVMKVIPSFGFDNLVADWAMLSFLAYFGDGETRDRTSYALSPDYFQVILDHDPYFRDAYFFLSASTSMYAGRPDLAVALMAEKLPLLSPQVPEGAYYVWRYKGTDELLFLGRKADAQESYTKAAEWATIDGSAEALEIARNSQETADFLAENPDSRNAQISAWGSILGNAFDEPTQLFAIQNIEALGGTVNPLPDGRYTVQGVKTDPAPEPSSTPEPSPSPDSSPSPEPSPTPEPSPDPQDL
ncbi:hypothetical protein [Prochlorothrix hollandica]|uniref:hypothetical protein n=1 Tax=Prochlorothrix hollandica TaxID=1223 RepID=UPI00333EACC1